MHPTLYDFSHQHSLIVRASSPLCWQSGVISSNEQNPDSLGPFLPGPLQKRFFPFHMVLSLCSPASLSSPRWKIFVCALLPYSSCFLGSGSFPFFFFFRVPPPLLFPFLPPYNQVAILPTALRPPLFGPLLPAGWPSADSHSASLTPQSC